MEKAFKEKPWWDKTLECGETALIKHQLQSISPVDITLSSQLNHPSFTGPPLHGVSSLPHQTIDKSTRCPHVKQLFPPISVHLSASACLSSCFSNCLEVKEVIGAVSVGLAADTLTAWVLGGLDCDGHYVGGWWEVWVASPWHLPLWHDVVDGCDERRVRGNELHVAAVSPANTRAYCEDKQHVQNWTTHVLSRSSRGFFPT